MKIGQFIKTDYPRVTMDARVMDVQEDINKCRCAVVFHEDGGVAGVLGPGDALKCTGGLIGHCRIDKPCIDVKQSLEEAVALMAAEGTDTLLVYDSEQFLGILAIHDLALRLIAFGKSQTVPNG